MSHRLARAAVLGLLAPLLLACGVGEDRTSEESTTGAADASGDPAAEDGHGEVAGAAELDEPQVGLTTVDAEGAVRHLDLLDESVEELGEVGAPAAVHTDGRFVFVGTDDGLAVVDSGVWTWDHDDHFHYYRAEPREVGVLEGSGPATVATTTSSTGGGAGVFLADEGEAVMLDVAALADGELAAHYRVPVEPHDGMLVPVGERALVTRPDAAGAPSSVVELDADGAPVPGATYPCADASGTIATRVGTVIGCADGALLATSADGRVEVERIAYPSDAAAPAATEFAGRDGRPTVAGLADADRVWMLDTRERSWRMLESPTPLAEVTAVDDDDEHLLGLGEDGRLVVLDGRSGRQLARTEPLAARSVRAGAGSPTLVADQQRAYLSAPVEGRMYEIDFADDARVARTFDAPATPFFLAGTGR